MSSSVTLSAETGKEGSTNLNLVAFNSLPLPSGVYGGDPGAIGGNFKPPEKEKNSGRGSRNVAFTANVPKTGIFGGWESLSIPEDPPGAAYICVNLYNVSA